MTPFSPKNFRYLLIFQSGEYRCAETLKNHQIWKNFGQKNVFKIRITKLYHLYYVYNVSLGNNELNSVSMLPDCLVTK